MTRRAIFPVTSRIRNEDEKTFSTLPQISSGQLLATIDDPFVVRQVNFAFTQSGLVLHTDYGAMSIYSCAL